MTTTVLERASGGDELAFRELTEPFRRELEFHCYRMLGSVQDAEDVLQETMLAAWRGLGSFERRSSLRTWLYRIATNRCLNVLREGGRRPHSGVTTTVLERASAGDELPSVSSRSHFGASWSFTVTGCSARCRMPRTCCRRRCWPPGARWQISSGDRACGPGFTGLRLTDV